MSDELPENERRALEALCAWALKNCGPPTDDEIHQFLEEFDQGKHPLSEEDKRALEKAEKLLPWRQRL